ncbi:MAG: SDR family NAD(P)-dependent oxidoreductase [Rickettsiales bacterium]|nr:SDR family NAD(P)-dependent oxidoreductase [Rickettsiales bacterium]
MVKNIAIIGGSGAIGSEFTQQLSALYPDAAVHVFSRSDPKLSNRNTIFHPIDYQDELSIESAAAIASKEMLLDRVIVATGILHGDALMPEKSLRDLSTENFRQLFEVNTILPALVVKHFLPKLNRDDQSIFVALSARVGSISDNRLGGWYAYRASKAALNMIIKSAAIEISRSNRKAIIVGLHPGTVDSNLSKPFQSNVAEGKLFTPEYSVTKMLKVVNNLTGESNGKCFAWDGKEIEA